MRITKVDTYTVAKLLCELEDYGELEGVALHITDVTEQIQPCLDYINFLEDQLMNNGLYPNMLVDEHNERVE